LEKRLKGKESPMSEAGMFPQHTLKIKLKGGSPLGERENTEMKEKAREMGEKRGGKENRFPLMNNVSAQPQCFIGERKRKESGDKKSREEKRVKEGGGQKVA